MSNIYVTEPKTNGKVVLRTTVGDIEIELWSKETPRACRNFVQLCMEGYYDDTAFHRLVRGFIVQGGDPTGTGEGGDSIYGHPFKIEVHTRLSFNRRGLVGMVCCEENANNSQFFFTLGPALELNGKHTLFGRIVGDTLYNMLRLGEGDVGPDEKPLRIHRIINTRVILNPYDDIVPRQLIKRLETKQEEEVKVTAKATKNFSLLSFGEEAEEEELVVTVVSEKFRKKGKSAHDLLCDPRLSSKTVSLDDADSLAIAENNRKLELETEERLRRLRENGLNDPHSEDSKKKRIEQLRQESEELRRQIAKSKRDELKRELKEKVDSERKLLEVAEQEAAEAEALARWEAKQTVDVDLETQTNQPLVDDLDTFTADVASYKAKAKRNKNVDREAKTMALLARFSNRLHSAINSDDGDEPVKEVDAVVEPRFTRMDNWMRSRLVSEIPPPARQVFDPSVPHPDRYDLYDPRNPLNVRKRGGDTLVQPDKKLRT